MVEDALWHLWQAPVAESQHKPCGLKKGDARVSPFKKIAWGMVATPGRRRATTWVTSDHAAGLHELVSLRSTKSYIWVGPTVIHPKIDAAYLKTGVNKARGQKLAVNAGIINPYDIYHWCSVSIPLLWIGILSTSFGGQGGFHVKLVHGKVGCACWYKPKWTKNELRLHYCPTIVCC